MEENNKNLKQTSENLQGPTLQQPNSPVEPQTPPQNRRFKLLTKAIIAIIIFLLLAGGIAASFTVFKSQIEKLVSKPTPTPAIVKTPTPTPDPTANWKTYANKKYGYSLKYPEDFTIQPIASTPSDPVVQHFSEGILINPPDGSASLIVEVDKYQNLNQTDNLQDYITQQATIYINPCVEDKPAKITPVAIAGLSGFKVWYWFKAGCAGATKRFILDPYVFLDARSKSGYIITFQGKESILDQILSTFKFTDSTQDFPTPNPTATPFIPDIKRKLGNSDIYWYVNDDSEYPTGVITEVKDALSRYQSPMFNDIVKNGDIITIENFRISTVSASFSSASWVHTTNGQDLGMDPLIFLFVRKGDQWTIYDEASEDFCKVLKEFPYDYNSLKQYEC